MIRVMRNEPAGLSSDSLRKAKSTQGSVLRSRELDDVRNSEYLYILIQSLWCQLLLRDCVASYQIPVEDATFMRYVSPIVAPAPHSSESLSKARFFWAALP